MHKVTKVCDGTRDDITGLFSSIFSDENDLIHFESSNINLSEGCWIEFEVHDTVGVNIGLYLDGEPAN